MRRLFVLVLACGLAALAAGCGVEGSGSSRPGVPEPGRLVLGAFRAAEAAGAFTTRSRPRSRRRTRLLCGSSSRATWPSERLAPRSASRETAGRSQARCSTRAAAFVRFMDRWYGEQSAVQPPQGLERELGAEEGLADRFDDVEGSVTDGPVADGVATWAFNGRLNVGRLLELAAEEGSPREKRARRSKSWPRVRASRSSSARRTCCRAPFSST